MLAVRTDSLLSLAGSSDLAGTGLSPGVLPAECCATSCVRSADAAPYRSGVTGRLSSSSSSKSSLIELGVSRLRDGDGACLYRRMSAGLELRLDAGLSAGLLGDGLGAPLLASLPRE